jgi:3-hydroxybutyryl-CoA dehydratase
MNTYRWGDIHEGLTHNFQAMFTEEMMQHYASLSGDFNPLHVDAEYAQSLGFPGPVVFGLMTSSLYSSLVGMYLPGKLALLQGIDIDFNSSCHAGETLSVEGKVTYLNEAYHRFEVRARIRKADGKLVSKATIRVGFHGD